jgi:hypothetical protein
MMKNLHFKKSEYQENLHKIYEELLNFAQDPLKGLGMNIRDARAWASNNVECFKKREDLENFRKSYEELLNFAQDPLKGLGMNIRDARAWLLESLL